MLPIMPATINFKRIDGNEILQGSDWYIEMTLVDRVAGVDTPINLTGYTGTCQIREDATSETTVAEPTITILDGAGGSFSISLSEIETAAIPTTGLTHKEVTRYQYEVQLDDGAGGIYRALQGYVEVSPTVIKDEVL